MNATSKLPPLHFTADGEGVASHAGARLLAELAERLGLTEVLSVAMAPTRRRHSAHDPGKVLVDLAVALAGEGRTAFPTLPPCATRRRCSGGWPPTPPPGGCWTRWTSSA